MSKKIKPPSIQVQIEYIESRLDTHTKILNCFYLDIQNLLTELNKVVSYINKETTTLPKKKKVTK